MQKTIGPKYGTLKQISKRALSWLEKPLILGGVWIENDDQFVQIKGKAGKSNLEGNLTLAEAKALKTLLDIAIHNVEQVKK